MVLLVAWFTACVAAWRRGWAKHFTTTALERAVARLGVPVKGRVESIANSEDGNYTGVRANDSGMDESRICARRSDQL